MPRFERKSTHQNLGVEQSLHSRAKLGTPEQAERQLWTVGVVCLQHSDHHLRVDRQDFPGIQAESNLSVLFVFVLCPD